MEKKQLTACILLSIPLLLLAQHETPDSLSEEAFDPNDDFQFQMKKPKIVVKGHVVCDQCSLGRIGNKTLPLHDAEVGVKCTDLYGFVTFSGVGYSDTHGVFSIPMDEIPAILGVKGCKAKLLRGPNLADSPHAAAAAAACDVVSTMGDGHAGAPLQLVHKSLHEVIFTSGPFACRPSKLPELCRGAKLPHVSSPPPGVPHFHAHTPPPVHHPSYSPPPPLPAAPPHYKYQSPPPPPPPHYKYQSPPPPPPPPPPAPVIKYHHPPPPQPPKTVSPVIRYHPPPSVVHHHAPPSPPVPQKPPPAPQNHAPPPLHFRSKAPPPPHPFHYSPPPSSRSPPVYKYGSPPPPAKTSLDFGMKKGKTTLDPAGLPGNDMND